MDATPRRRRGGAEPEPARSLRVASWNVAGLRGLLKREEGRATLRHLVASEQVDVVMLQATVPHSYLTTLFNNTYPYQAFAYMVGVAMVFRTNVAYNRYWEGITHFKTFSAKW